MEINIEQLTKEALNSLVREAAKQVIVQNIGSGIQSPVKDVIVAEAERLIREDEEVKDILKGRLIHWISEQ